MNLQTIIVVGFVVGLLTVTVSVSIIGSGNSDSIQKIKDLFGLQNESNFTIKLTPESFQHPPGYSGEWESNLPIAGGSINDIQCRTEGAANARFDNKVCYVTLSDGSIAKINTFINPTSGMGSPLITWIDNAGDRPYPGEGANGIHCVGNNCFTGHSKNPGDISGISKVDSTSGNIINGASSRISARSTYRDQCDDNSCLFFETNIEGSNILQRSSYMSGSTGSEMPISVTLFSMADNSVKRFYPDWYNHFYDTGLLCSGLFCSFFATNKITCDSTTCIGIAQITHDAGGGTEITSDAYVFKFPKSRLSSHNGDDPDSIMIDDTNSKAICELINNDYCELGRQSSAYSLATDIFCDDYCYIGFTGIYNEGNGVGTPIKRYSYLVKIDKNFNLAFAANVQDAVREKGDDIVDYPSYMPFIRKIICDAENCTTLINRDHVLRFSKPIGRYEGGITFVGPSPPSAINTKPLKAMDCLDNSCFVGTEDGAIIKFIKDRLE